MPKPILLLLTALAAAPLHAAPLAFGEIDGRQDFSSRPEVAVCSRNGSGFDCVLTRTSFGGLPLTKGQMLLDAWGRVRSLQLMLDREDYDRARGLLAGRYGQPATPEPLWTRFDDDARISLRQERPHTLVTFEYPRNDAAAYDLRPSVIWTLLVFTLGGLATGAALRRARHVPGPQAQPISMKQTLERRMREGRELNF